jgi:glycosyltransferase involved in cell wall biosynthesis
MICGPSAFPHISICSERCCRRAEISEQPAHGDLNATLLQTRYDSLQTRPLNSRIQAYSQRDLSASGFSPNLDAPEPRLAILGPPAITRRMFELWRDNRRLQATFDLGNPLHRRDFLLWLCAEGRSVGFADKSIAAAMGILRQATSLVRAPPRWPLQATRAIIPSGDDVDAWLTEPIVWDFGAPPGGIPLPRVLALLWEQRQDVRLHFPNRTPADVLNYLAWCLTQGVHDRCVPVDLTEPGLAAFLDMLDPELGCHTEADGLPVTRLFRIMAPLYDGPYPEFARQFPRNRQARFCIAIWVCDTLRSRYGWPVSFIRRPLQWLSQIAPEAADAFVSLDNRMLGLWELRPDLQTRFHLRTHESRAVLLAWFLGEQRGGFGAADDSISTTSTAPATPRAAAPGRSAIVVSASAVKRDLCLIGYADLVSGRAEDLRMSALVLRGQGSSWAILDRLSGQITTESRQAATAFAEPPRINLLHLNADTAFFDYLFLRERGIERSYTIGCWAWELAKFPVEWASAFAFVDEIWTASRFAYEAIAPATTKPVLLMPSAVAPPVAEPGLERADFGLPENRFLFYFGFDFRSYARRKNPLAAVEAFRRAFPRRSAPVFLLLKTIGSDWNPHERATLDEAIRGDTRIAIIDRELTRPRATGLLALTDCFLSLHRSEGFGRGPAEAMLLGKPVIATDYSGTRDFITRDTALPIDYELVPVGAAEYPGGAGQVWAEPDLEHAAAAMRRVTHDPAFAKRLGNAGQKRIRELYDPTTIGTRLNARLRAIRKS